MKSITIHRLALRFAAGRLTHGDNAAQAARAVGIINEVLRREVPRLNAELIAMRDEIEIAIESEADNPSPT